MTPMHYQVVGEEDYALVISIDENGAYTVVSGTYTSEPPRSGQLSEAMQASLLEAVETLGVPTPHDAPEGAADAFRARLTLGSGSETIVYPFWEGALQEDEDLLRLVRLLEQL